MGFLDSTGLAYFYTNKIKGKFLSTAGGGYLVH